ncbi:MAG: UDP-N-acetylmuramoyl-L-alanyl-D-glutamate--2,6-diaminopimelate ligase [Deltaproteobacteria bacterium]|nr:UDP-N-acetylmuramoyl-L-alanyl-D-glutamate--2,6-diaminopimelate ligase [Deltaproteobacteria bacterium]
MLELFPPGEGVTLPQGAGAIDVTSLSVDSRGAKPGALFAALKGVNADGAQFAPQAVQNGAAVVLAERELEVKPAVCVVAKDARKAFAIAAARFHGEPSRAFKLLGVTGTNGKTTTTYLIEQMAAALGERAGVIGTVEQRWPGHMKAASHTTPESHELQEMLSAMAKARVDVAAIEVSSHALAQERVAGCVFAGAAFTNLTRDHLDYHRTLDAYFDAKARLFRELLPKSAPAVLNLDDLRTEHLAHELAERGHRVIGFTLRGTRPPRGASLLAGEGLVCSLTGLRFHLRTERAKQHVGAPDAPSERFEIESPLIGAHNAENLLTALGLLAGGGLPLNLLARVAKDAKGAPGRLERVMDPHGRIVLVDYAHSDDALGRVLDAIVRAGGPGTRTICVFGCGGDRDKGKRTLMGEAAGRRAQLCVATSDNPRTEDPKAILGDIEPGLIKAGRAKLSLADAKAGKDGFVIEPDRRAAIEFALACARPGDAVLIAGKGHESVQIVGAEKRPFDDRAEAAQALVRLGGGK